MKRSLLFYLISRTKTQRDESYYVCSEMAGEFLNLVMENYGEDQWDRSRAK